MFKICLAHLYVNNKFIENHKIRYVPRCQIKLTSRLAVIGISGGRVSCRLGIFLDAVERSPKQRPPLRSRPSQGRTCVGLVSPRPRRRHCLFQHRHGFREMRIRYRDRGQKPDDVAVDAAGEQDEAAF